MSDVEGKQDTVEPVPKWLQARFGQLWGKYAHTQFTLEDASKTLNESKEVITVILSRLRQSGWITVSFDKDDFRKRNYQLLNPSEFFRKIVYVQVNKNAQDNKD